MLQPPELPVYFQIVLVGYAPVRIGSSGAELFRRAQDSLLRRARAGAARRGPRRDGLAAELQMPETSRVVQLRREACERINCYLHRGRHTLCRRV